VRTNILEKYRNARLRVYAVWTVKLTFDARDQWDGGGLADPRVVHLWDPQDRLGEWLVANEPDYQAGDWDAYALFGPHATWHTGPPPLLSSGGTVIGSHDQLAQSIAALL
jgi:hypothetical protein